MSNVNCVVVEGNVTRLPELKTSPNGFQICKIPIAVNRSFKNSNGENTDEVSFFDVETFGKLADMCSKYAEKGRGLSVVGRMKQNRWKTDDGKTNSRITIVAEHVEFKTRIQKPDPKAEKCENENLAEAAMANAIEAQEEVTF